MIIFILKVMHLKQVDTNFVQFDIISIKVNSD